MELVNKRKWKRPELIILTHNNEDEVLTLGCKTVEEGSSGPNFSNNKCDEVHGNICGGCQGQNDPS